MKYRAAIKKEGEWWVGWLVDLPGVNAQERTYNELIESLGNKTAVYTAKTQIQPL